MLKQHPQESDSAEVIALRALAFLASDPDRFARFLRLTGLTLSDIRERAAEPRFLAAVMTHLRGDQSLLLMFAERVNLHPSDVDRAGRDLVGEV